MLFTVPTPSLIALVKRKGLLFSAIMSTGRICPCNPKPLDSAAAAGSKAELAMAAQSDPDNQSTGETDTLGLFTY